MRRKDIKIARITATVVSLRLSPKYMQFMQNSTSNPHTNNFNHCQPFSKYKTKSWHNTPGDDNAFFITAP
jgi:hypothetical protein